MRAPKVSSAPPPAAPKPPGRAPKWRSSPPRRSFSSPIISAARRCSPVRSRRSAKSMARSPISRTSRARRAPSARSRSPTPAELLEVSMIASVAGEIEGGALTNRRPFRAPHHSASMPALVGGGLRARPGEISLAHHGVLFLDELPEFQPQVLDSLRQPLEIGEVAIARANHRVTYPARFMLVAAMNPCRCGRASEPGFACKRGANARCAAEYQGRLSGPLIDRIDLHIEVPAVTAADLILPPPAEGSREVAARVARARAMQEERYAASACRRCAPT